MKVLLVGAGGFGIHYLKMLLENTDSDLKRDIRAGLLGKPVSMAAQLCSPRDFTYYNRGGGYAGNVKTKVGTVKNYGMPEFSAVEDKFHRCVAAVKNGTQPICTVKTATPLVQLCEDLHRSVPVESFPEKDIVRCEDRLYVASLADKVLEATEKTCLLSRL